MWTDYCGTSAYKVPMGSGDGLGRMRGCVPIGLLWFPLSARLLLACGVRPAGRANARLDFRLYLAVRRVPWSWSSTANHILCLCSLQLSQTCRRVGGLGDGIIGSDGHEGACGSLMEFPPPFCSATGRDVENDGHCMRWGYRPRRTNGGGGTERMNCPIRQLWRVRCLWWERMVEQTS